MKGRIAIPLLATTLVLGFHTREGVAQVLCYSGEMCLNNGIGQFSTPQDCCMVDNALSFESGDCENCYVYGWKDILFPIEVRKGGTLILTVGYLKGTPLDRVYFDVDYDSNNVSMDRTSFILGTEDEPLQVTVLDDGQSVVDDRNITITLVRLAGGSTHDIIISEATLIIPASMLSSLVGSLSAKCCRFPMLPRTAVILGVIELLIVLLIPDVVVMRLCPKRDQSTETTQSSNPCENVCEPKKYYYL